MPSIDHISLRRLAPQLWPFLAIGTLAFGLLAVTSFTIYPLRSWLVHYGVPAQAVSFGDLRDLADTMQPVPAGGSQAPSADPAADSVKKRFPYPSIWRLWRYLGLSPATATGWGIGLGLAFIITAVVAVRPRTHAEGIYLGILLCSPVCVLLIERANGDSLIFSALALGVMRVRNQWINTLVVLLGACAKLYPGAAAVALPLNRHGRSWWPVAVTIIGLGAYMYASWTQWQNVASLSIRIPYFSFGVAVPVQWMGLFGRLNIPFAAAYAIGLVPVMIVLVIVVVRFIRARTPIEWLEESERRGLVCGTAIVGAAFLFGSRFQYSFVYALFCLPALFRGVRLASPADRKLCLVVLSLFGAFFWWDGIIGESRFLSVLFKHGVCVAILALLLGLGLRSFIGASPVIQRD